MRIFLLSFFISLESVYKLLDLYKFVLSELIDNGYMASGLVWKENVLLVVGFSLNWLQNLE